MEAFGWFLLGGVVGLGLGLAAYRAWVHSRTAAVRNALVPGRQEDLRGRRVAIVPFELRWPAPTDLKVLGRTTVLDEG